MSKFDMTQPVNGPLAELPPCDFEEFIRELGGMVWATPGAAAFARHEGPLDTIKDYMDIEPEESKPRRIAKELWKDLCGRTLNVDQLCRKWYGKSAMEMRDGIIQDLAGEL